MAISKSERERVLGVVYKARDELTPAARQMLKTVRAFEGTAKRSVKLVAGGFASMGKAVLRVATGPLRIFSSLIKSLLSPLGLLTSALAAVGLVKLVDGATEAADKVDKLSTRLGIATDKLQELKHVSQLQGVEFNTLTMGLQRMTRRISEAAQGMGEARGALQELGLSAEQLNRMSPDEQLMAVADAMGEVDNQADRVRLAMRLFDSEGVALVQVMADGGEAMRTMAEDARRLGAVLNTEQIGALVRLRDEATRFTTALSGLKQQILGEFGPLLADLLEMATESVADLRETVAPIARVIAEAFSDEEGSLANEAREVLFALGRSSLVAAREIGESSAVALATGFASVLREAVPEIVAEVWGTAGRKALEGVNKLLGAMWRGPFRGGATGPLDQLLEDAEEFERRMGDANFVDRLQERLQGAALNIGQDLSGIAVDMHQTIQQQADLVGASLEDVVRVGRGLAEQARREMAGVVPGGGGDKEGRQPEDPGTFGEGAAKAYQDWVDNILNAAKRGREAIASMLGAMEDGFGGVLDALILKTQSVADAFREMGRQVLRILGDIAAKEAAAFIVGSVFNQTPTWLKNAQGNVFEDGRRLQRFARGGVVDQPMFFPMRRGAGLMGEAGPEGILPLQRTPSGDLGVQAVGAGASNVTVNFSINTVDARGFDRLLIERKGVFEGMIIRALRESRDVRSAVRGA